MKLAGMDIDLTGFEAAVMERLKNFEEANFCDRLWNKDSTIWRMELDEQFVLSNSMGWRTLP